MKGKFLWFNKEKKFGFIKGENNDNYFVHISQINTEDHEKIEKDVKVKFSPVSTDKGLQAKEVVFF